MKKQRFSIGRISIRNLILFSALALMASGCAVTKQEEEAQTRVLDVTPYVYAKPLTVEVSVNKEIGRIKDSVFIDNDKATTLNLDIVTMRAYATHIISEKYDADVIVAPIYNVYSSEYKDNDGYWVVLIGFPANFTNWKTATKDDYDWISLENQSTNSNNIFVSSKDKMDPNVKLSK